MQLYIDQAGLACVIYPYDDERHCMYHRPAVGSVGVLSLTQKEVEDDQILGKVLDEEETQEVMKAVFDFLKEEIERRTS